MTIARIESFAPAAPADPADLSGFCQELFASFARSDQRRWGEVYVRGLYSLPGRKTIRRISDHVVGWRADQSLQQFVNQSPWRWEPVRGGLAREVAATLRPRALVVAEAVFPKNGASSVGVAKQFAPSCQRMLNCQLGLAVFLACDEGAVPIDWRLELPREWDEDTGRRARSRVPAAERHRPRWAHVMEMLEEIGGWDLPALPVLVDARHERHVEALLRGLEGSGLQYVVQISEDTPVAGAMPAVALGTPQAQTAGELVRQARRLGRMTMNWRETAYGQASISQFVLAPLASAGRTPPAPARLHRGPRQVLAERVSGRVQPDLIHLTNITQARLPDLVHLVRRHRAVAEGLTRLHDESGLADFEGRSFRGWHHHVTLASVAHAYRVIQEAGRTEAEDARIRPYA
ncbi:transposase [Amycolatopsis sp. OK19-0408]|uniref:Transposase n=1 Tax=Amycolatopsis iheyensis TaxID=2945988 RepID=A0A9X2NER0_9PSEU|nr:transposase [Amycolatopsis iheyensis]MCR6487411.1 transposase [Amycolatopsis iheyensis]